MESIKFQCEVGAACKHWRQDVDGGCAHDEPEIHVHGAHGSGHFAEALCLTFAKVGDTTGVMSPTVRDGAYN